MADAPRICVIRVGGTNCDFETKVALDELGARSEIIHAKRLVRDRLLKRFDALVIPGGFSYGDHIRAGAILGRVTLSAMYGDLRSYLEEGRPILGICNGFQVLVESGLLPGFDGSGRQEAALALNVSGRYECRWVYLRHDNIKRCIFTRKVGRGQVIRIPVAHAEGRFVLDREKENLKRLIKNDQIVFRYCDENGKYARGRYPLNPNGSLYDIAGICDPSGLVFGLMPHPERAFYGVQLPDWTSEDVVPEYGDGRLIFKSLIEYLNG
ncbi:MAG: phosphoribosylformylglycinamidine synthase subunit PurQ [Candidatus Hadarchaeales archaeon]